jgi:hypothetical protein
LNDHYKLEQLKNRQNPDNSLGTVLAQSLGTRKLNAHSRACEV